MRALPCGGTLRRRKECRPGEALHGPSTQSTMRHLLQTMMTIPGMDPVFGYVWPVGKRRFRGRSILLALIEPPLADSDHKS